MTIDTMRLDIAQAKCGKNWKELGINRQTLTRVKHGKNVRPKTVYMFAEKLGCTTDYLLGNDEKDNEAKCTTLTAEEERIVRQVLDKWAEELMGEEK